MTLRGTLAIQSIYIRFLVLWSFYLCITYQLYRQYLANFDLSITDCSRLKAWEYLKLLKSK